MSRTPHRWGCLCFRDCMQTMLAASLEEEGKHTVYSIYFNFQTNRHPGACSFREEFFHFFFFKALHEKYCFLSGNNKLLLCLSLCLFSGVKFSERIKSIFTLTTVKLPMNIFYSITIDIDMVVCIWNALIRCIFICPQKCTFTAFNCSHCTIHC